MSELTAAEASALVAALPQAIAVYDEAGAFRFCNSAFLARAARAGARAHELATRFGCGCDAGDGEGQVTLGNSQQMYSRVAVPGLGWLCTLADTGSAKAALDELTGLAGRGAVRDAVRMGLLTGDRNAPVAFAMIDLDRFKTVNDTLGHATGDKLLKTAADRMRGALREGDLLARVGGDEFAVVQVGGEQPAAMREVTERLVEVIARPYVIDGQMMEIGASVGVAIAPGDADSGEELMQRADVALYRAKADGRGGVRFFEEGMDEAMHARRALEADLRRALAYREFELYYQPQKDLPSGRITGFEALVRWNHPERGLVTPDEFIPLAEETGFIVPLGEWIIRQACLDCAAWPESMSVAVNVSTRQLMDTTLVDTVRRALEVNGLDASRFEAEVTESVLMADTGRCTATLRELQGLGARVSLDDFGTGYSSISYLRSFPFDKLKIDQSFIRSEAKDANDLVKAIIDMSRHFGMEAVAEGVETAEQAQAMHDYGCRAVQGYWLSRAVPGADALVLAVKAAEEQARSEAVGTDGAMPSGAGDAITPDEPAEADRREQSIAPSEPLVRLVYTSRNVLDVLSQDLERSVAQILQVARERNAAAGVTGALLFNRGHFAQVLEGPASAVEATFERIQRDDRHAGVNLIEYGRTAAREFGEWSMAFTGGVGVDVDGLRDPRSWSAAGGGGIVAMLSDVLADEERHAPATQVAA